MGDHTPPNTDKTKKVLYIVIGLLVLILVLGGFGGNNYLNNANKKAAERVIEVQDSIQADSQKKQDALVKLKEEGFESANIWMQKSGELEIKNWRLNEKLKKRERERLAIDTVFMSNGRRISESSNRFYQSDDSLR
tara:strand:+ start:5698 stop:6105 length:408 start_codon:yes stop_codon:yes gene_type:complete